MKSFKILNSKKIRLLLLVSLVLTLTLGVYLYRGKEVVLEVDGEKTDVVSYSKTVGDFLEQENVDFKEGAFVNLPLETKIEDSLNIIIINPKTYSLKEKDSMKVVSSIYDTVGRVLKDKDIELGTLDYTKPASAEKIEEGDTIEIIKVTEETVVEDSKITFEKIEEKTNKLFKGEAEVKQNGEEGIKSKHIKKRYENGELVKEELVKEEVTKEKKDRIVLVGNKAKPTPKAAPKAAPVSRSSVSRSKAVKPSRNNSSSTPSKNNSSSSSVKGKTITMNASAYDLSYASTGKRPGDKAYGITASGMKARYGVVAVDPKVIPLGTKLYIEGYGNAIAGDTGGAIKGNRIDLFYNSNKEAMDFGRRQVKVTILD